MVVVLMQDGLLVTPSVLYDWFAVVVLHNGAVITVIVVLAVVVYSEEEMLVSGIDASPLSFLPTT